MSKRITVYLAADLLARLDRQTPSHRRSGFIAAAVAEKLAALERQATERALDVAYRAAAAEREEIEAEWQHASQPLHRP